MIPSSTYRLQFNRDFTFDDAVAIVPYLAKLGVGALYASPLFAASPGSTHGYDVIDYGRFNPEIGDDASFARLNSALLEHGLGLLLDVVPNHMGVAHGANVWWQDVLENGQTSVYAAYFDIDWQPVKAELRGKMLLPILGDAYGDVLERGELRLRFADGSFFVDYFETGLPLAPPSYPMLLNAALPSLMEQFAADDPVLLEFQSVITAFERLAPQNERDPDLLDERRREQVVAKRRLSELTAAEPAILDAVNAVVVQTNGSPGDVGSFDALNETLDAQSYRLASFRTAAEEINYRRFFAINELAAIRQEEPEVFAATHEFLLRLIGGGAVTGVRIDHPDGLWDPAEYFRTLQTRADETLSGEDQDEASSRSGHDFAARMDEPPLYLVVEKILEGDEQLPEDWAVHGTVGYEFARVVNGLFVDGANRKAFDELYERFTDDDATFADLVYEKKKLILRVALASELNVLARALNRISEHDRRTRDFTFGSLTGALQEVVACFPIYRTYIDDEHPEVTDGDQKVIREAITRARRRNPATDASIFAFIADVLLLHRSERISDREWEARRQFAMKFQQLTGPVMAKGVEDTAFYLYNRLTSLNEVGGAPDEFGTTVARFHRDNANRRRRWPHAMLTSSTHDTKRSEDVRARINVLSELPRDWRLAINRWTRFNRRFKSRVEGELAPHRQDEYLFYQTLLGVWPSGLESPGDELIERVDAYMLKAVREGQARTTWINPNTDYEEALHRFVQAVLQASPENRFLPDFATLQTTVADMGAINSLAQHLLKLTAPGVPDIYQGTELLDFSLVDPDNRRPVDFARRSALLEDMGQGSGDSEQAAKILPDLDAGEVKLLVTARTLHFRRGHPDLFAEGDYSPLTATGKQQDHVVAFARRLDDQEIIVAVPRLVAGLTGNGKHLPTGSETWGETRLSLPRTESDQSFRNVLTGGIVTAREQPDGSTALAVSDLLGALPVAVLERIESGERGNIEQ